jgi:hypothetical protein
MNAVVFLIEATELKWVIEVEVDDFESFLHEEVGGSTCGAWDGPERCRRPCIGVRKQGDMRIALHAHTLYYVVDAQEAVVPVCERHDLRGDLDMDPVIHRFIDGRLDSIEMEHIAERARWN